MASEYTPSQTCQLPLSKCFLPCYIPKGTKIKKTEVRFVVIASHSSPTLYLKKLPGTMRSHSPQVNIYCLNT